MEARALMMIKMVFVMMLMTALVNTILVVFVMDLGNSNAGMVQTFVD